MTALHNRFLAPILVLVVAAFAVRAADTKSNWDPVRTTFPTTTDELKALQTSVKQVVEKTTPATVAILLGNGAGSGVIVSDDGLILTAAHVIGWPGQTCTVELPDGKRLRAKTLGVDHENDSGMLKITDNVPKGATWPGATLGKWPTADLGTSGDVKKNQWVVSLGHPGGPKKDRRPPVRVGQFLSAFGNAMMSDCTLVGGDSGGPLFDLNGKVIGIHSRIGLTLDNNIHVPADIFKKEWDQLKDGYTLGPGARNVIGVQLKRKNNEDDQPKAVVEEVTKDGPADKAGIKVGDVIIRLNGNAVPTSEAFDGIMQVIEREGGGGGGGRGGFGGNSRLRKVVVERDGETKSFDVTAVRRQAQKPRGPGGNDKELD
jgi:serine protease Do